MIEAIPERRLLNQCIDRARHRKPADVVEWLGAVQAQEYEPAKWGLGLRMADGADADIERAFEQGRILRTHVMRPTWHFVTPADIRWMLELTAPSVHRRMAIYDRQLGLDAATKRRGTAVIERALRDGQYLTRVELGERLKAPGSRSRYPARASGDVRRARRGHLQRPAPRQEVHLRADRGARTQRPAVVARRVARRTEPALFQESRTGDGSRLRLVVGPGHGGRQTGTRDRSGPGSTTSMARSTGPPVLRRRLRRASSLAHLLPIYDEYIVSYRDRVAVPHGPSMVPSGTGGGYVTFQHALVIGGQIAGTWRISRSARGVEIAATALRRVSPGERRALADAADRYGRFLGIPVELVVK